MRSLAINRFQAPARVGYVNAVSTVIAQMEGLENLPAKDEAAVYVANHQSFLVRPWPRRRTSSFCLSAPRRAQCPQAHGCRVPILC